MTPQERADAALNRLCKFRTVFTGWMLGSRPDTDGPTQAYRDLTNTRLVVRTELSAAIALLIRKGLMTADELNDQVAVEADHLTMALEAQFPGFHATDEGLRMDPQEAAATARRLGFPP